MVLLRAIRDVKSIEEFRLRAEEKLDPSMKKYISGSHNTQTDDNVKAFHNYLIRPYIGCDTTNINMSTTMLGHPLSIPICIAPMERQQYINPKAERITAAAAKKNGIGFSLSGWTATKMEDLVADADTGLKFLNMYIYEDKSWTVHLARKAEKYGFHGLLIGFAKTNPAAYTATLHSCGRSRYANLEDKIPSGLTPRDKNYPLTSPSCSWADIKWLKSITRLPVIAKGILSARDAIQAVNAGVDAVLVSNHGGRQLQGVPAPIDVLPEVVRAVGNRCEVYMDGGIRTGSNLFIALALGARAVFIGRPILWGYACGDEKGISDVIDIYKQELSSTMTLAGVPDVSKIPGDVVIRREKIARL
ncbi:2-Hydroxyacid oxidase 1-like [Watersipora subatra]|uniref:2-Hydroxyacid oxidase 1-like n=1 Tax=Watersipora subatra TaxID=2589382 RepID=UPI00355C28BD